MPAPKDVTGQKYGNLTVLKKAETQDKRGVLWTCQCECGNIIDARCGELVAGQRKHCGCGTKHSPDESGNVYGRLTVLRRKIMENQKDKRAMWECVCTCGNAVIVAGTSLRQGTTRSCGCLYADTRRSAGMSSVLSQTHGPYNGWDSMGRDDRLARLGDDDD